MTDSSYPLSFPKLKHTTSPFVSGLTEANDQCHDHSVYSKELFDPVILQASMTLEHDLENGAKSNIKEELIMIIALQIVCTRALRQVQDTLTACTLNLNEIFELQRVLYAKHLRLLLLSHTIIRQPIHCFTLLNRYFPKSTSVWATALLEIGRSACMSTEEAQDFEELQNSLLLSLSLVLAMFEEVSSSTEKVSLP